MPDEGPKIEVVNGYQVIEASTNCFKVFTDDHQMGTDFHTFSEAAAHARSLESRNVPRSGR